MKRVIFTDLDGTLLDAGTYSWEEAAPALELVRSSATPLVFSSSKTRAEIEKLRRELANGDPFVAENGGGVFIPEGYFPFPVPGRTADALRVTDIGLPYARVRRVLKEAAAAAGVTVRGFGDMTDREVARLTGLGIEEAALARRRDYDEPFVVTSGEAAPLLDAIEARGLRWTRGGLLYHIMGRHDKGQAVRLLKGHFERAFGAVETIGLGDGRNDLELLAEVDRPVLVRRRDGTYEPMEVEGLVRTEGAGPAGWNEAVGGILGRP